MKTLSAWLFLAAYTFSGLAGLVYEVTWTRLLTLYIGHTTAAASAVVAAFLGGLAIGAAVGGRAASRLTPKRALQIYVGLEIAVAICAVLLPIELSVLKPVLRWAYADGAGALFPLIRVASCIVMVMLPALALGATFPMAVRWYSRNSSEPATESSTLYFLNTVGAAIGSLLAGFVLIPSIGMRATIYVAMAATTIAAVCVLVVARTAPEATEPLPKVKPKQTDAERRHSYAPAWLAIAVLGLSGFAALVHEIAWTRILSLILGPTTYAFAATLAAVIAGAAIGSGIATWLIRTRAPKAAGMLAFALLLGALTAAQTYAIAGHRIPMMVARYVADFADFDQLLVRGVLLTMALILPTSACIGAAFPFALSLADDRAREAAGRFGLVYAINTVGSVAGSLATGFIFIPWLGIQPTLWIVSGSLVAATIALITAGALTGLSRAVGLFAAAASIVLVVISPGWDRELLASGVYMYAPYVPKDLDLETQLKAGDLLYYREGAAATVSVKKLTGTTTLAIDGKTDASNRGDMLTQKLIAHIPLMLHPDPKNVFILGLGSGMTVGAALTHPIERADVVEMSPEVVEASAFFKAENRNALADPRTHLIIGDGRSHLALSNRKYDVIISEPSNPWIAGVASLFTKEFFDSARRRLAPGGIICQWVNGYNISDADLKSVLATFISVFPQGAVLQIGTNDVLMLATAAERSNFRRSAAADALKNTEVAADLATVGVVDAFSIDTLVMGFARDFAGRPAAPVLTDDRLTLEFTAPWEIYRKRDGRPALSRRGDDDRELGATGAALRNRADMLFKADHFEQALDDYLNAVSFDSSDSVALDGVVKAALILKKPAEVLKSYTFAGAKTVEAMVARSKLLAASGKRDEALALAREAAKSPIGLEQLASLFADSADTVQLDATVAELRKVAPNAAPTEYYAAVAAFLHGDANEAAYRAERAIGIDPNYTPSYDLVGAAYTKLGRIEAAKHAFERSLSFDAHDSTAYENLGVLELNSGNRARAAKYFAEALWLVPDSQTARQGLAQSKTSRP